MGFQCGDASSTTRSSFTPSFSYGTNHANVHKQHQASARNRNSIIVPGSQSIHRYRADSGGNRGRSNSEKTEKLDGESEAADHPVEPRSRTALLPPIMVCLSSGSID